VVKPFADSAVNPQVGAGFAGLVEEQLIGVWRRQRRVRDDGYNLDFVVADVEVFADEDALSRAVGDMAQVDQLKLIAAVLSLIDTVGKRRRLAASGELLPAGGEGSGVALALHNRQQLEARGILWERAASTASAGDGAAAAAAPPAAAPDANESPPPTVTPYYRFARPAAAWVQYEAAVLLDSRVSVITSNAESFSLLSTGIELHRDNRYVEAAEMYAQALEIDPDNVAALVNFALLLARSWGLYAESIVLLLRARRALANAYAQRT
jgi:tetratricopeptide (TPR) repeat protein